MRSPRDERSIFPGREKLLGAAALRRLRYRDFQSNSHAGLRICERGRAHSAIRIADSLSALPNCRRARYYGVKQYLEGAEQQGSAPMKETSWIRRASLK